VEQQSTAEPLRTVKQAATELGLPYFKLARAIKGGPVPHYTIWNSRRLVRVSEIVRGPTPRRKSHPNLAHRGRPAGDELANSVLTKCCVMRIEHATAHPLMRHRQLAVGACQLAKR
jgi:hypothetical protein